jgi:hypothetical protein
MNKVLLASDIIGSITDPWATISPGSYPGTEGQGLIILLNNILKTTIVVAGIWSLINLIVAGFAFMSAQGSPEKITDAWNKIWQTLVGLTIVAGSLVLAAIFGYLVFNDPMAIIQPKIYGPGTS